MIADCTSCAAASMSRSRSNCSVICDRPNDDCDDMVASAGIWPNWRSSGRGDQRGDRVGIAPGSLRRDLDGRKIDLRQGDTGRREYPSNPASRTAIPSSEVAIGRAMKAGDVHGGPSPPALLPRGAGALALLAERGAAQATPHLRPWARRRAWTGNIVVFAVGLLRRRDDARLRAVGQARKAPSRPSARASRRRITATRSFCWPTRHRRLRRRCRRGWIMT